MTLQKRDSILNFCEDILQSALKNVDECNLLFVSDIMPRTYSASNEELIRKIVHGLYVQLDHISQQSPIKAHNLYKRISISIPACSFTALKIALYSLRECRPSLPIDTDPDEISQAPIPISMSNACTLFIRANVRFRDCLNPGRAREASAMLLVLQAPNTTIHEDLPIACFQLVMLPSPFNLDILNTESSWRYQRTFYDSDFCYEDE